MNIIGMHTGHDASLSLVRNGKLVSSLSVERYSRVKKDEVLSREFFNHFLQVNEMTIDDIDCITMAFWNYNNCNWIKLYSPTNSVYPLNTFGAQRQDTRILNHLDEFPYKPEYVDGLGISLPEFIDNIDPPFGPEVIQHSESFPLIIDIEGYTRPINGCFVRHHTAHAAAAFYTSPFPRAAVFTADASMHTPKNCSTSMVGNGSILQSFKSPEFMLGNFYDVATEFCGLGPGTLKAGTLMGLSSFGNVNGKTMEQWEKWCLPFNQISTEYHRYSDWLFSEISGRYPFISTARKEYVNKEPGYQFINRIYQTVYSKEESDSQEVMDIAASIQYLLERALIKYINELYEDTKNFNDGNLCLAGGTFLNCNANYKILKETKFKNIHFFPACGDDGIPAGSALFYYHFNLGGKRVNYTTNELAYLGVTYDHQPETDTNAVPLDLDVVAQNIADGKIVCWYQGHSEVGPRALGNRSFISDPRNKEMKDILNSRVKFREWFRPFAPVVLTEDKEEWFNMDFESPFMLHTVPCRKPQEIPSAVHIDNTSRVQTLTRDHNPIFYDLISKFKDITGVPVVLNTSLNVKGEPIVETPEDAMKLFDESDVDILVINDMMYFKN
jgi:carbamoyltransferase